MFSGLSSTNIGVAPTKRSERAGWHVQVDHAVFFRFLTSRKATSYDDWDFVTRAKWSIAFTKMDSDGDGSISRKEWCLRSGDVKMFDAIKKNFAALQAEGTGRAVVCQPRGNMTQKEWMTTFDVLDVNQDGYVSIEEFVSLVHFRASRPQGPSTAAAAPATPSASPRPVSPRPASASSPRRRPSSATQQRRPSSAT